ncbi:hemerythrin domain-containing protein [Chitinimonas lacunae]|uniref:Hemerythrin domain-containing protein n=1 Tax=Chitinimonas lacunae TaxID=1963018 RepID=A0ABV8MMW3_9NEIS
MTATTPDRSRSTSTKISKSAQQQVIALLKDDHKRVKKAFREFEKADEQGDMESCAKLVKQVCDELEVHAKLEEELFYPQAREALKEEELIDEAEVEHKSLKRLIADLKAGSPDDPRWKASFTVLAEYVKHHVREEENEIFPQLEKAKLDWEGMLEALQTRKAELMKRKGMTSETAQASPHSKTSRSASRSRPH